MRLTVLGSSPSWPHPDGACSGYLVEEGADRLLLDCGPGAFAKLRGRVDYREVGTVVLSHLHADHVLDLVVFASALRFSPRRPPETAPPALLVPPGGAAALRALSTAGAMPADHVESAFALREYDPAGEERAGALRIAFQPVPHFVPTWALAVAGDAATRLVYGADTGPSDALVAFARDADLLLAEATLPEPDEEPRGHLTPREAGEHARAAGARRLLVTHYTDELDTTVIRAEAERGFGAPVALARSGDVIEL